MKRFGLEVTALGEEPIVAALDQERYMINAGAHWGRKGRSGKPKLYFQCSGIDDREDDIVWLKTNQPAQGSWLEIAVVDAAAASAPRPKPRKQTDWKAYFDDLRARDQRQVALLESRLKRSTAARAPVAREWPVRPPQLAFRITLNGKDLCTAAVGDPGSLTVTVYARFSDAKPNAILSILGGDQKGPETWQWYDWKVKQRLSLRDRLRIAIVRPARLSQREPSRPELPPTRETMALKLAELQEQLANPDYYDAQARAVIAYQQQRPPQRRYSR